MSDVRAAAIGGAIAVVGLLVGTWVEKWLDKDNFDHSFTVQAKNDLVLKRYQLISDFSNQVNASDYVNILDQWNQSISQVGPIATRLCEQSSGDEVAAFNCLHDKIMATSLQYRRDISERNSKFVATMQMSGLLFGPKVQEAVGRVDQAAWWKTKPDDMRAILSTMRDEIYYFENSK